MLVFGATGLALLIAHRWAAWVTMIASFKRAGEGLDLLGRVSTGTWIVSVTAGRACARVSAVIRVGRCTCSDSPLFLTRSTDGADQNHDRSGSPAEEVFAYVTDPTRFAEWQEGVVNAEPHAVGDRCLTTRRIGGTERLVTSEITHIDPPRGWGIRGLDGPIRATVDVSVKPLNEGKQSRVTIDLAFTGHGIGKLLMPLAVRRSARKEMPANLERLKQRLESTR